MGHLIKHAVLLLLGFVIMFGYTKFRTVILVVELYCCIRLYLFIDLYLGSRFYHIKTNASRWIRVPIVGVGFQTSTLASLVLMVYVARYLAKNREVAISFKLSLYQLWLPVGLVLAFILPANFSTTAILFSMVLVLTF